MQLTTLKFVARQVEHAVVIRATTRSTCNATMLRDKLNKSAVRITGPLFELAILTLARDLFSFLCSLPLGFVFSSALAIAWMFFRAFDSGEITPKR